MPETPNEQRADKTIQKIPKRRVPGKSEIFQRAEEKNSDEQQKEQRENDPTDDEPAYFHSIIFGKQFWIIPDK